MRLNIPKFKKNRFRTRPPMSRFEKIRRNIYLFVIIVGLMNIFFPVVAYAGTDIFNNDIQDVYVEITENVDEANDVLQKAFQFSQVSPYTVINMSTQTTVATNIINASRSLALIVAVLLLMVDFFRKTVNFEWSSKWENVLIFLIKIVVVKQVVQNADVIVDHIYSAFSTLNHYGAVPNFLPAGHRVTYTINVEEGLLQDIFQSDHWYQGWIRYWENWGASSLRHPFTYEISQDAVKMFYPNATFPSGTVYNFEDHPFGNPTAALSFTPTLEILFWQPYFLVMKAIAYIIFVIAIGRIFELSVYTIFAPLPIATFASDTTHDVAKSFLKNYIATVMQIAVIIVMFVVYIGVTSYIASGAAGLNHTKMMQFIALIALGLGVIKSGTWAKKVCGAA